MNVFYLEYFICRRNTYQVIPSAQMFFLMFIITLDEVKG